MKDNEYQCALCKGIFQLVRDETWSQEKADKEYKKTFPNSSMKNRDVVCDDCWKLVRPIKEILNMMKRKMLVEFDVEFDENTYTIEYFCKLMHDYVLMNRFVSQVIKSESYHPKSHLTITDIRLPNETIQ